MGYRRITRMTLQEFQQICVDALREFKDMEPDKSGNMKKNATQMRFEDNEDGYEAIIRINPSIAPYSVYTVIPWSETSPVIVNAPRRPSLKGKSSFLWNKGGTPEQSPKKNPNEGWIDAAVELLAEYINNRVKGELTKPDGD